MNEALAVKYYTTTTRLKGRWKSKACVKHILGWPKEMAVEAKVRFNAKRYRAMVAELFNWVPGCKEDKKLKTSESEIQVTE